MQDSYRLQHSTIATVTIGEMKEEALSLNMVWSQWKKQLYTVSWKMISVLAAVHYPELLV